MKKYLIPLLFLNCSLTCQLLSQQPCNDDIIMNKKGAWKNVSQAGYMKAGNQTQVISRIDKMQKLLQTAYPEPKGIEANWYRSMNNNPLIANGSIPYQLNSLFLAYYCNTNLNNRLEPGGETGTWFYVWANHFNWFVQYVDDFVISKQPVYLLTQQVGELNGYPVYKGIHNESSNTGIKYSRAIILTRDGQLPYIPVPQKKYLKVFILFNKKKLNEELVSLKKIRWLKQISI